MSAFIPKIYCADWIERDGKSFPRLMDVSKYMNWEASWDWLIAANEAELVFAGDSWVLNPFCPITNCRLIPSCCTLMELL